MQKTAELQTMEILTTRYINIVLVLYFSSLIAFVNYCHILVKKITGMYLLVALVLPRKAISQKISRINKQT